VEEIEETNEQMNCNSVEYIANNSNDQEYMIRLSNFLELFLPNCKEQLLLKWIPTFCQLLVKKSSSAPRISKIYQLLKTMLKICSKHKFFRNCEQEAVKQNTYNMLLTFLKELIGKSEEF
jgi:hypothetical protein